MYHPIDVNDSQPFQSAALDEFCIVVPVFLRVKVRAEDDLQAECRALDLVRGMGEYLDDGSSVKLLSIIAPAVNTNPEIENA